MTVEYLKRAAKTASQEAESISDTVKGILDDIEQGGEAVARQYATRFDQYDGALLLSEEDIAAASAQVSQKLKDDIAFAHDNVRASPNASATPCRTWKWKSSPDWSPGNASSPCHRQGVTFPVAAIATLPARS